MIPLDLNLASRPIRNNTLLWIGHAALAILLVAATAWNVSAYARHRADLGRLRVDKNSLESLLEDLTRREAAARRAVAAHDLEELTVQAAKASDVIRRKALSWTRLFNLVEEILPYEVRMVSVRPVFAFRRSGAPVESDLPPDTVPVSVEGSARNLNAMLEFQRALIFDEHFSQVEPHRFQQTSTDEVLFDLRFLYDPNAEPAPEEPPADAEPDAEGGDAPAGGLQAAADASGTDAADGVPPKDPEAGEPESGAAPGDAPPVEPAPVPAEPPAGSGTEGRP